MRAFRFSLAGLLALGMIGLVQAQPGGGGGRGGLSNPSFLIASKAVQEDIKLTEDQVSKLKDWGKEFQKKAEEIRKDKGVERGKFGEQPSAEQIEKRAAADAEIAKEAYKQLGDVLKKEQVERLKQIQRQALGVNAFTNAEVVGALKLTAAQKDSVKGITGDYQKESREIFGEPGKGKIDFTKIEENMKKVQKLQKEYVGKLEELLDDTQKKTWKDMKGEAFDTAKLFQFTPRKKD